MSSAFSSLATELDPDLSWSAVVGRAADEVVGTLPPAELGPAALLDHFCRRRASGDRAALETWVRLESQAAFSGVPELSSAVLERRMAALRWTTLQAERLQAVGLLRSAVDPDVVAANVLMQLATLARAVVAHPAAAAEAYADVRAALLREYAMAATVSDGAGAGTNW